MKKNVWKTCFVEFSIEENINAIIGFTGNSHGDSTTLFDIQYDGLLIKV